MFGRHYTPSMCPSLLMFRIDHLIARISSSLVLYRVPHSGSFTWRRDRKHMDSCEVSTVDVPESPIASGTRGVWQQQLCDPWHYHEEWRDYVPPSIHVFSSVHGIMISSAKWKNHCGGPGTTQHPCYGAVSTEHQQRWTRWWCTMPSKHLVKMMNEGVTILKVHKRCTPVNKAMSEISNCCHFVLTNPCIKLLCFK